MINGISLFANVGIGELYLKDCGINIVIANEIDKKRCEFYKVNHPYTNMICGDINENYNYIMDEARKYNCKFLMATPPCQGMSVAGKRNENDPRNNLIIPVLNAIQDLDPDYVLIENVPQLLKLKIKYNELEDSVENIIIKLFSGKYNINSEKIMNAENYGIPQNRKRAIILLSKNKMWHFPKEEQFKVTVRDAIGDLPSIEAIVDNDIDYFPGNMEKIRIAQSINMWHYPKNHSLRHVEVMMHTETGKSAFENEVYFPKKADGTKVKGYNTTYKRMSWDKPAPTITMANGVISSQCNVHPGRKKSDGTYSDARVLTIYEIMKLFTIPETWIIPSWATDNFVRKVIGEAIPPLLVRKIVELIKG